MRLTIEPSNRCVGVHPVKTFSVKAMQTELLRRRETSSGFTCLNSSLPVSNETVFKVFGDGRRIVVAALLLRPPSSGALPDSENSGEETALPGETLELLFDPRHDHIGYFQFLFVPGGEVQRFQHLPYAEAHSTAFPFMKTQRHLWEPYVDRQQQLLGVWFFAWFDHREVFRHGAVCGFNLCRSPAGSTECGSWNPSSGVGFPDATSFGHLHASPITRRLEITEAEYSAGTLRLTGRGLPSGRLAELTLIDPLGRSATWPVKSGKDEWMAEQRLTPVYGMYRLYPGDAECEPHYFSFQLAGKTKTRPAPFAVGMEYDYPDNVIQNAPYTPDSLGSELTLLKNCGLNRIYWIDYPLRQWINYDWDAYPGRSYARRNFEITRKKCGEILPLAARLTKAHGLDFFGVYKVFDLGYWGHPEWSMAPNPAWIKKFEYPVRRIRLYSQAPLPSLCGDNFRIWVSDDNRQYRPYRGSFVFRQGKVRRPHLRQSPAGNLVEKGRALNAFVEFADLNLTTRFIALDPVDQAPALAHRTFALIEATDAAGNEAPAIPGHGSRDKGFNYNGEWSWGNRSERVLDMFEWRDGALGIRFDDNPLPDRKKNTGGIMEGLPEPMFEDVRARWLEGIRNILDTEADGVDIRVLCHHVSVRDYMAVAFAEPVRRAFLERYGREATPEPADYERIRRLRGEAFTAFMREAKALAQSRGKTLCAHIECGQEVAPCHDLRMQIHFDWERWIEEGLLDEITLKFWAARNPFVHERILPKARQAGIPVHICDRNSSLQLGRGHERAESLIREARARGFAGYHFYETASYFYVNSAGTASGLYNIEAALRRAAVSAAGLPQ